MESKRRLGDRKDGRLIHSLAPFYKFMPYIMPTKTMPATSLRTASRSRIPTAGCVRSGSRATRVSATCTCSSRPMCAWSPCVPASTALWPAAAFMRATTSRSVLTVRRTMSTTSNETTIKAVFAPTDTIFDVYRKMNEKIDEIKYGGEDNNTEQVAGALLKLPRFLLRFAIGCLRVMDYFWHHPAEAARRQPLPRLDDHHRHGLARHPADLSPPV